MGLGLTKVMTWPGLDRENILAMGFTGDDDSEGEQPTGTLFSHLELGATVAKRHRPLSLRLVLPLLLKLSGSDHDRGNCGLGEQSTVPEAYRILEVHRLAFVDICISDFWWDTGLLGPSPAGARTDLRSRVCGKPYAYRCLAKLQSQISIQFVNKADAISHHNLQIS